MGTASRLLLLMQSPFTPALLDNLAAWYRADLGVTAKVPAAQFTRPNSEWLSVADAASLRMGDTDWGIIVRFNADSTANNGTLVARWGVGGSKEWAFQLQAGGTVRFGVSANGTGSDFVSVSATDTLSAGTTYTVVAYHDSVNNLLSIWVVGGDAPATVAHSTGIATGVGDLTIGANNVPETNFYDGSISFVGLLDEIPVTADGTAVGDDNYWADLSAAEQAKYVHQWDLQELSGTRAANVGGKTLSDNATVTAVQGERDAVAASLDGLVSAWADQSGNGNTLSNSDDATMPEYIVSGPNSLPTIRSNGTDQFLRNTSTIPVSAAPITAYLASASTDTATIPYGIVDTGANNDDFRVEFTPTGEVQAQTRAGGSNGEAETTVAVNDGNVHLVEARFISATSRKVRFDGANEGTDTTDLTPSGLDAHAVGRLERGTPTSHWAGDLSELVVVDADPSTSERNSMGSYSAARYGHSFTTV